MEYINCFQITSLVLVTMIAIHYFSHKRLNNAENRNFVCFLAFSGVYVLLDMLSAVIAGGGSSEGCKLCSIFSRPTTDTVIGRWRMSAA